MLIFLEWVLTSDLMKKIFNFKSASGRAGRFSKDSLIIYQTFDPSDKTLNSILKNEQENF